MTNEKPTNPSHGELLDDLITLVMIRVGERKQVNEGRVAELRSLILGKMGEGWRCFHCDEVFADEAEAREHFGDERFETPGCISPLRSDEKARLKEVADAWAHAKKNQADAEKKDDAEGLLESFYSELRRYFGDDCTSVWLAGDRYNNSRYALKLAEATASRLQSELEGQKLILVGRENFIAIVKRQLEAAEARLAAQPDVREIAKKQAEAILISAQGPNTGSYETDAEAWPDCGLNETQLQQVLADVLSAHLAPQAGEKWIPGRHVWLKDGTCFGCLVVRTDENKTGECPHPYIPAKTGERAPSASHTPRCPKVEVRPYLFPDGNDACFEVVLGTVQLLIFADEKMAEDFAAEVRSQFFPVTSSQGGATEQRYSCKHCKLRIYPDLADPLRPKGVWRHVASNFIECFGDLDSWAEPESSFPNVAKYDHCGTVQPTPGPKEQE